MGCITRQVWTELSTQTHSVEFLCSGGPDHCGWRNHASYILKTMRRGNDCVFDILCSVAGSTFSCLWAKQVQQDVFAKGSRLMSKVVCSTKNWKMLLRADRRTRCIHTCVHALRCTLYETYSKSYVKLLTHCTWCLGNFMTPSMKMTECDYIPWHENVTDANLHSRW